MYVKDSIKDINPYDTYLNCLNILNKLDIFNKGLVSFIDIKYKTKQKFNVFASSLEINFGPIWDLGDLYIRQGGKGLTYEQCMASIYMETFERVSAILYVMLNSDKEKEVEPIDLDDYDKDLSIAIDYSKKLYVIMKEVLLNFYSIDISFIKRLENKNILFTNLVDNKEISLPYQMFYYNGLDGLNAGNSKEEAILGGIYEVIERYCQKAFLEGKDDIEVERISLDSVKKEIPELKETIVALQEFKEIDKMRLIKTKLKGTGIYTYIFFIKTTKLFANFGAGTHIDERIALIRAITELVQMQPFENIEKLSINTYRGAKGSVHISEYFSQNVLEKKFIDMTEEVDIKYKKPNISSIKEVLDITVNDLKQIGIKTILVKDITSDKVGAITYIVRIPKFSLLWYIKYNSFFYTFPNTNKTISTTIKGLENLFVEIYLDVNNSIFSELDSKYYELIHKFNDDKLLEFIDKHYNKSLCKKDKPEELLENYKLSYNKGDLDSFLVFHKTLSKKEKNEEDYLYIFEVYSRIGFLDYGLTYLKNENISIETNNKFKEIYDNYLDNLYELYKNGSNISNLKRKFVIISKYIPDSWSKNI